MQTAYLIFTFVTFAGLAGTIVWLHRRMLGSGVENVPYWRMMILVVTTERPYMLFSVLPYSSSTLQAITLLTPPLPLASFWNWLFPYSMSTSFS